MVKCALRRDLVLKGIKDVLFICMLLNEVVEMEHRVLL